MSLEARISAAMDKAIAEKRIVGTVVMVARDGELIFSRAAGLADREAQKPVKEDTIFRYASVTKPFVAITALALIDKRLLALDERVRDYLPWFHPHMANGAEPDIRIRHLLTHTSGLDYVCVTPQGERINGGLTDSNIGFQENFELLNNKPLAFEPGTKWTYSLAMDILGGVLARIHGDELEHAILRHVGRPLGLKDSRFFVAERERVAQAYADGEDEPVLMKPYHKLKKNGEIVNVFGPLRIFNPNAYQSGGGGMAGTASDVLQLLQTLVAKDSILKPETAQAALANQIGGLDADPGQKFSFVGAVIDDPEKAKTALPKGSVTWGGVYGNCWSIDPESKTVGVIMTNTAMEGCNGAYPEEIWQAIYAD